MVDEDAFVTATGNGVLTVRLFGAMSASKRFRNLLHRNRHCEEIILWGTNTWSGHGAREISSYIWNNPNLRKVSINIFTLPVVIPNPRKLRSAIDCLLTAVSKCRNIEDLILLLPFDAYTCSTIGNLAKESTTLKFLELLFTDNRDNGKPQTDLNQLAHDLNLAQPDLSLCLTNFRGPSSLADILTGMTQNGRSATLGNLTIAWGDTERSHTLQKVERFLQSPNITISRLELKPMDPTQTDHLTMDDVKNLTRSIVHTKSIEHLVMSSYLLPTEGTLSLMTALQVNTSVKHLEFSTTLDGFKILATQMPSLVSLKTLDVTLQQRGGYTVASTACFSTVQKDFLMALQQNKNLINVTVRGCGFLTSLLDVSFRFQAHVQFFGIRNKSLIPMLKNADLPLSELLEVILSWKESTLPPTTDHSFGTKLVRSLPKAILSSIGLRAADNNSSDDDAAFKRLSNMGISLLFFCFQERPEMLPRLRI